MFIYGLFDPVTLQLRYIGKTTDPYKRENEHNNRKGKTPKDKWIEKLKSKGLDPFYCVIEECDDNNCWIMERYFIKKYNHKRNKLLNVRTLQNWGPEMDMLIKNGNFYKTKIDGVLCPVIQLENGEVYRILVNKKPKYYIRKEFFTNICERVLSEDYIIYITNVEKLKDLPKRFKYPYFKPKIII